jgi:hypothetical protein
MFRAISNLLLSDETNFILLVQNEHLKSELTDIRQLLDRHQVAYENLQQGVLTF